jgi:DNA-binding MarR family transcriptional regulator
MEHTSGSPDERLALALERISRSVHAICFADGLHPVQWSALRYFAAVEPSRRTVSGLARHLGVTQPPASRTVSTLVQRGCLATEADAADRRSKIVSLTPLGAATLRADPLARIRAVLEEMGREHPSLGPVVGELERRLAAEAARIRERADA